MSSELPLVSVIIACYNHAPYIEDCIRSVLAQTYPRIELLVTDDGSTDGSVDHIESLRQKNGFYFSSQSNRGLPCTLNDMIARSQGSLIVPFGSDDVMLADRIAKQVAYLQGKPEVGACAGNIELIDERGETIFEKRVKPLPSFRRLDFEDVFAERKPYAPAPTLMFRREALEKVGGFDEDIRLEDLLVQLKVTHAGYYIDVLEDVLARYRKHATNNYKRTRFMTESVLASYALFSEHPLYERVRLAFIKSMFLKSANRDKTLARELLVQLPLHDWDTKVLRGLWRLFFSPE